MSSMLLLAGCGGTLLSVRVPELPEPGPSKFESFEDWDARKHGTTRATTGEAATQPKG